MLETENSVSNLNSDSNSVTQMSKEILNKINEVRQFPIKIANKITQVMSYINKRDNILREPRRQPQKLTEGIKAYEEAITFLKNFSPIEPLIHDELLCKIAQDHANDIGPKNILQGDSSDNKIKFDDRFKRFATYSDLFECHHVGDNDALRIVVDFIVCDGDLKRSNREIILSNNLRQIGIGIYENLVNSNNKTSSNNLVVVDLARNWKNRPKIEKMLNEDNSSVKKKLSKINNFKIDLDSSLISFDKSSISKKNIMTEDEIIIKYEKELDQDIWFDQCVSRKEEKQIITENDKIKIIKKLTFEFNDGSTRRVILSKTWKK